MERTVRKYETIYDYPIWVVFLNMIRMYSVGTYLELDKLIEVIGFNIEYDRLLQYKSVLVRNGYIRSISTYDIKILEKIPFGLTGGGNIGRTKVGLDKDFSKKSFFTKDIYEPVCFEKDGAVAFVANGADVVDVVGGLDKKAKKINSKQIPESIGRNKTYAELLDKDRDLKIELGITLRCKNVKKNVNGSITDFDFSEAEISISRLIIDENKYDKYDK